MFGAAPGGARSTSMDSVPPPGQNHLLAELQEAEFGRLSPFPELVRMARGDMLYQSGGNLMHLSFPTMAIISIDYVLEDGGTSEIAGHVTVSTTQRSRPMNRPARHAPAQPASTPATAAEQHEEY